MIEKTFPLTGPADLDVSVPSGSVAVEEGPPGSAEVTIDTNAPDAWRVYQNGDAVTVAVERTAFGRSGRARVRMVVPPGSSLKVATASADLRVRVDLGDVTVATASGDVLLADVGAANIKTASGDVIVGAVQRDLAARSASGDIRAGRVAGSTSLTTASGDVTIDHAAGPLSATSASGDVRVRRYVGDDVEASTMSGDVEVGLPAGTGVKLSAKTLSGRVHLPDKRQAVSSPDRQVTVRLKSVSGDILLRRLD